MCLCEWSGAGASFVSLSVSERRRRSVSENEWEKKEEEHTAATNHRDEKEHTGERNGHREEGFFLSPKTSTTCLMCLRLPVISWSIVK